MNLDELILELQKIQEEKGNVPIRLSFQTKNDTHGMASLLSGEIKDILISGKNTVGIWAEQV